MTPGVAIDRRTLMPTMRIQGLLAKQRWAQARDAAKELLGTRPDLAIVRLQHAVGSALSDGPESDDRAIREAAAALPAIEAHRLHDSALRCTGGYTPLASLLRAMETFVLFSAVDVFMIEFPKCGRTWLREMVGRAIAAATGRTLADPGDLLYASATASGVPIIEVSHDDYPQLKPPAEIVRDKSIYSDKKVLLLVRDPRDVMISLHFQRTERSAATDRHAQEAIGSFIDRSNGGLASLIAFYNAWAAQRSVPREFLMIRYEDLRRDTASTLARVLAFLEIPVKDGSTLAGIVEECSFANMQAREKSRSQSSKRLAPGASGRPESFKVRRGKVGGYRDYLSPDEIAAVDAMIAAELDDLYADYKRPATA